MDAHLRPSSPYNFELLLIFLSRWRYPSIDFVVGNAYRRVLRLPEGLVLIEVRDQGAPKSPDLSVTVLAGCYPEDLTGFRERVTWVLHTDHDTAGFWTWARSRPDLWPPLAPVEGLPMPRTET